jgi:hypothetical protein
MIKILAIGNSFSQDAAYYLHDIAKAGGIDVKMVNLFIGGCSLETHWKNIETNAANYYYELNGQSTDRMISIKEALLEESWDYITLQQVSSDSGIIESYYPYFKNVLDYVRELSPKAKILLHQTWAYEVDSTHSEFAKYDCSQEKMYQALMGVYQQIAEEFSLELIPCGEVIQNLRKTWDFNYVNGGASLCRDGFHMDLIYGRYAVAATWYETILHKSIIDNTFIPEMIDNREVNIEKINLIKKQVSGTLTNFLRK